MLGRALVGLTLVGYGVLGLARVLAHDSLLASGASLIVGLLLLWGSLPPLPAPRAKFVAGAGVLLFLGVLAYNAVRGSGLGPPEWCIALYGAMLAATAPFLDRRIGRTTVGTVVGWSFPLLFAPLALFAVNGALSSPAAGAASTPLIVAFIVLPIAFTLRALGVDVAVVDRNLVVPTDRGPLTLDVGLVCAGLYPMVLFAAIVALHTWRVGMRPHQAAVVLASGIVGLWMFNLVRILLLVRIGIEWGGQTLIDAHANLGWILFGLFMLVFCALVLRTPRPQPTPLPATP